MKREIKFRGLRADRKVWVYGYYIAYRVTGGGELFHNIKNPADTFPVKIETIGQFTGLKDKNGVDIYEGDIVKWGHLSGSYEDPIRIAVVSINPDISFTLIPSADPRQHVYHYGTFIYKKTELALEVIGNIHESTNLPLIT